MTRVSWEGNKTNVITLISFFFALTKQDKEDSRLKEHIFYLFSLFSVEITKIGFFFSSCKLHHILKRRRELSKLANNTLNIAIPCFFM